MELRWRALPAGYAKKKITRRLENMILFLAVKSNILPLENGIYIFAPPCNILYYIEKSVLVENRPPVKFIRNYIRDSSGVFSISSLVRVSMTSFPAFTLLFMRNTLVYIIKRNLHSGLKILILFSRGKNNILFTCCARS